MRGEFRPDGQEREWCDVDVLRQLRRRSLASFRRQVEPVGAEALARFLPTWHGLDRPGRGHDALWRAVAQLQGAALPASVLETDLLPARVRDFAPADLDALLASRRPRLDRRRLPREQRRTGEAPASGTRSAALADAGDDERPAGPLHDALRTTLAQRGALFWPDLFAACGSGTTVDEALTALWDLVWSGEVTNDTLAPLRGLLGTASSRRRTTGRGRPRPGQLRVTGPPSAGGRWSLTAALLDAAPSATEAAHLRASVLIERHGVLTREAVLAEGVRGGFAAVYPVLRALEDRGQVRRGYFVAGLGGAQFASLGAIDRLREHRDPPEPPAAVTVLAATDPAQPYGCHPALARVRGPTVTIGGCLRRARRRWPGGVPGTRWAQPGDVRRPGARRRRGSSRSRAW